MFVKLPPFNHTYDSKKLNQGRDAGRSIPALPTKSKTVSSCQRAAQLFVSTIDAAGNLATLTRKHSTNYVNLLLRKMRQSVII